MDRQLYKIYIIIVLSIVLIAVILPAILGKTSGLLAEIAVKANLLIYNGTAADFKINSRNANIVFIFDDGWETQYTQGFKILKKIRF